MSRNITSRMYGYISKLYAGESDIMQQTSKSVPPDLRPISITPMEGKIIEVLLKTIRPRTILELGTLAGYSTFWLLNTLSAGGRILTLEKNETNAALAAENFANAATKDGGDICDNSELTCHHSIHKIAGKSITIWLGEAIQLLPEVQRYWLLHEPLDAMFIDADKNNYKHYFAFACQYLRPGGVLIIDNTLSFGNIIMYEEVNTNLDSKELEAKKEMLAFNEMVASSDKFDSVILATDSGLTVAVKRF